MFSKILIANRGEIACRVAATARRMGIATVAVYSDADARAAHVMACDEAVAIGGSAPADSYLRSDRIVAAARTSGAQAVHPGYGFLSENAAFAQACADAGLVFIGPSPAAMVAMGLKAEAKRLMEQAGVPLVPGYHGADQRAETLQRAADGIGYPVLIKASAGGGGRGMRVVSRFADFADALAACRREAAAGFGNDAVLIEKYLQQPRHIEVQVFGDIQGNYVHLFERDCSVQRRHQKVLEEAPAPGITEVLRQQMGAAALAAARAVGYVGAGTVEFIVETHPPSAPEDDAVGAAHAVASVGAGAAAAEPSQGKATPSGGSAAHAVASVGAFYFMEMNTRLQVEHPVTEAITGQDLVEWQLRVAAGEPLPCRQDQLHIRGHAIEARICAENPDQDFLPATGTLAVMRLPHAQQFERTEHGVRIDSGVGEGDAILPFYDPMVAKLIVHGASRANALARLDAALAQTHIAGVGNNVQFLRYLVRSDAFAQARLDTGLIEREAAALFNQEPIGLPLAVATAVAQQLLSERATETADPFSRRDGWRLCGEANRLFDFSFAGRPVVATLHYRRGGALHLHVAAGPAQAMHGSNAQATTTTTTTAPIHAGALTFTRCGPDRLEVGFHGQRHVADVYKNRAFAHIFSRQGATQIEAIDRLASAGAPAPVAGRLTAPMPGRIVSFAVAPGDRVQQGQPLAVMEAMKMEHTIAAPTDGTVAELLYAPGDQVDEGAALLRIDPA